MFTDFIPLLAMVLIQVGFAGMNITSKLAMDSGMKPLVLVTYRQVFATLAIIPLAYFFEWRTRPRPRITKYILLQIFFCSITGATGNQLFYFIGLEYSTPTVACALNNLLPAVTFVFAVIFRQEVLGIKKASGIAKVVGTIVCVAGAMVLSFYHGNVINVGESKIHWSYAAKMKDGSSKNGSTSLLGPIFVMASCVCWAAWFIIQAKMSEKFSAPYTTTLLMCLMASIECFAVSLMFDQNMSSWSLTSTIRLVAAIYAGVVASALAFCVMSWTIQIKGPLYVSVFNPSLLIIVAVLSWMLLHEKLYLGTVVGSVFVIIGLYTVLWGKDRENKEKNNLTIDEEVQVTVTRKPTLNNPSEDLEAQPELPLSRTV